MLANKVSDRSLYIIRKCLHSDGSVHFIPGGCSAGDSALSIMEIQCFGRDLYNKPYHSASSFSSHNFQIRRNLILNPRSASPLISNSIGLKNSAINFSRTCSFRQIAAISPGSVMAKEEDSVTRNGDKDLLVVGPGVLGRIVADFWLKANGEAQVYGQTRTDTHHEELRKTGIKPVIKGSEFRGFPFVIFCAPPSGNKDYAGEVRDAVSQWSGEGALLFTSSAGLYDCKDEELCTEDTPTVPLGSSARTDVLLQAEAAVLEHGGSIVRLAGLYLLDRGAHMYYLKNGVSDLRPDYLLNLIHYKDVARLCKCILDKRIQGQVFVGCDGHPVTRQEMMDQVNTSDKFNMKFNAFTGVSGPLGKRMDNKKTREAVSWEPEYKSFPDFLRSVN